MDRFIEIVTRSESETIKLGICMADQLTCDMIIPIVGPLGVGKSVLVRGIVRGMGYDGRVRSPSYTIERIYITEKGEIHHWDLYRLEDAREIEPIFDEIRIQNGIRVIEWGERLDRFIPDDHPYVELIYTDEANMRIIKVDKRFGVIFNNP